MRRKEMPLTPSGTGIEARYTALSPRLGDGAAGRAGLSRGRLAPEPSPSLTIPEESIVVDDRTDLTPAEAVENKLMALLKETSMPVSHLQKRGFLRGRAHG
jgi:hypothetical protein